MEGTGKENAVSNPAGIGADFCVRKKTKMHELGVVFHIIDDLEKVGKENDVENGKILLPIGAGTRWLCNKHSYVKMWFEQDGNIIKLPNINEIKPYRVRDINVGQ